jgi:quinol-cytochrome oxidoreductase complex cytochrome b subunit
VTVAGRKRPSTGATEQGMRSVRASELLRTRRLWLAPLLIASVFIALISTIYIGSVVNRPDISTAFR